MIEVPFKGSNSTISLAFGHTLRIASGCGGNPVHCGGSEVSSLNWVKVSTSKLIDLIKLSTPSASRIAYETGSPGHWSNYWPTITVIGSDCEFFQRPALQT